MEYMFETAKILGITLSTLSDLIGISYTEMSDIIERKLKPTDAVLKSCSTAREIFLDKNNTLRVTN